MASSALRKSPGIGRQEAGGQKAFFVRWISPLNTATLVRQVPDDWIHFDPKSLNTKGYIRMPKRRRS